MRICLVIWNQRGWVGRRHGRLRQEGSGRIRKGPQAERNNGVGVQRRHVVNLLVTSARECVSTERALRTCLLLERQRGGWAKSIRCQNAYCWGIKGMGGQRLVTWLLLQHEKVGGQREQTACLLSAGASRSVGKHYTLRASLLLEYQGGGWAKSIQCESAY